MSCAKHVANSAFYRNHLVAYTQRQLHVQRTSLTVPRGQGCCKLHGAEPTKKKTMIIIKACIDRGNNGENVVRRGATYAGCGRRGSYRHRVSPRPAYAQMYRQGLTSPCLCAHLLHGACCCTGVYSVVVNDILCMATTQKTDEWNVQPFSRIMGRGGGTP